MGKLLGLKWAQKLDTIVQLNMYHWELVLVVLLYHVRVYYHVHQLIVKQQRVQSRREEIGAALTVLELVVLSAVRDQSRDLRSHQVLHGSCLDHRGERLDQRV